MTIDKSLEILPPPEPDNKTGSLVITQFNIENISNQTVLDQIKQRFGQKKPSTLVCCDNGIAKSRFVAKFLFNEDAVRLCRDHFIDEDNDPTGEVQGAEIPWFEFKVNDKEELRSDCDASSIDLLIICTNSIDAYRGDKRSDIYERRMNNLTAKLERAIDKTRQGYVLHTMIIQGGEFQFLKVFLGMEYDEDGLPI